jgi:hypothetical protein
MIPQIGDNKPTKVVQAAGAKKLTDLPVVA